MLEVSRQGLLPPVHSGLALSALEDDNPIDAVLIVLEVEFVLIVGFLVEAEVAGFLVNLLPPHELLESLIEFLGKVMYFLPPSAVEPQGHPLVFLLRLSFVFRS